MTADTHRPIILATLVFGLLLTAYHLIYVDFFYPANGLVGADYALTLPGLLDGFIWFRNNGILEPPWFSPSFCGGQPFFADPQSSFYSILQFLSFIADPLLASYLTLLIFASLGYWGFYLLARRRFSASAWAAILAGALYMFNGFLAHRTIIGHLGYPVVTLSPWIALLLCARQTALRPAEHLASGVAAGLLVGLWLQSGLTTLMIPAGLGVLALGLMHGLAGGTMGVFLLRSAVAALVGGGLSASKIVAGLSFMEQFPRSDYTMGGFESFSDVLSILVQALFLPSQRIFDAATPRLTDSHAFLAPHEWAFDFTPAPLPLLIIGLGLAGAAWWRNGHPLPRPDRRSAALLVALALVLAIPFALAWSSPDWHAFLKTLPVIKSASTPFRWIIVLIPIAALSIALLLDRVEALSKRAGFYVVMVLLFMALLRGVEDRSYYRWQRPESPVPYDPSTLLEAWHRIDEGNEAPAIREIIVFIDPATGRTVRPRWRNETLVQGGSQLLCYNPIFGYDLEHFPLGSLHPGPIFDESDGRLNLKNPACYVFPLENRCAPGDHFMIGELAKAERFAAYLPWEFERSERQRVADWVTILTLIGSLLWLLPFLAWRLARGAGKTGEAPPPVA